MSITKAIEKINTEMQKNPEDKYTEAIGHYCIDRVNDETAELFLVDSKTLKGALDAVKAVARKNAQSGVCVMTDDEVFSEVNKYFGLNDSMTIAVPKTPPKPKAPSLDLDFDSFL